jgi:hypothetical protein
LDDVKLAGDFAVVRGCEIQQSGNCAGRVRLRDRLGQEQGVEGHDQRSGVGPPGAEVDPESAGRLVLIQEQFLLDPKFPGCAWQKLICVGLQFSVVWLVQINGKACFKKCIQLFEYQQLLLIRDIR